jgi:hypothetical protein
MKNHRVPTTTLINAHARVVHATEPRSPVLRDTQDFQAYATIKVLELTETSATIGWYDPTRCRYDDQRWRRFKTLQAGVCAMTGTRIAPGADCFHPVLTRSGPANAGAMILALALQCVGATDSA